MDVLTAEIETTSSALFRILWILSECLDAQESKTTGRSLRLGDRAWMVFRSHLRGEYRIMLWVKTQHLHSLENQLLELASRIFRHVQIL